MKSFGLISIIILILSAAIVYATERNKNEKIAQEIYKNLRCLSCEGQSISDSESEFARSTRSYVEENISKNMSKEDIYDELRLRYGDEIFFKPPLNNKTIFLWIAPFFLIFIGFVALVIILRKKNVKYIM
ncbi:MAG TPA: cytochrome c-type biogenesis protein CcmH [Alphaproteobacteria bacterium]|nr:cytochrome c-type biogenesis protein CcmH [Alphaproteobacteria bacterium]